MNAVIFDLDRTLCNNEAVRRDPFYTKAAQCLPNEWAMNTYRDTRELGNAVLVVTNRRRCWGRRTATWLRVNGIEVDALYMRRTTDLRDPVTVKNDLLTEVRKDGYEPYLALEDDPRIVALWRHHGIPVATPGGQLQ